jgi:hypothetical protein
MTMQRRLNILPILLFAMSLPAFAVQLESPSASSAHRTQVLRPGKGEPRVRDAVPARTASPRTPDQNPDKGRTRPYQVPKPGEGAPKG